MAPALLNAEHLHARCGMEAVYLLTHIPIAGMHVAAWSRPFPSAAGTLAFTSVSFLSGSKEQVSPIPHSLSYAGTTKP
jgi:uncharacterized SAM-binding protein YcdF (DUF218 family)